MTPVSETRGEQGSVVPWTSSMEAMLCFLSKALLGSDFYILTLLDLQNAPAQWAERACGAVTFWHPINLLLWQPNVTCKLWTIESKELWPSPIPPQIQHLAWDEQTAAALWKEGGFTITRSTSFFSVDTDGTWSFAIFNDLFPLTCFQNS